MQVTQSCAISINFLMLIQDVLQVGHVLGE